MQITYDMLEWDQRIMSIVQPSLNYIAPEYIIGGRCDSYADIYSLGVLSVVIFNKGKPPFDHQNMLDIFRRNIEKVSCCFQTE